MGADLYGHSPCHFTHRRKQRKTSIVQLNGLISDGCYTLLCKGTCQFRLRSQMQIGKEDQPVAKIWIFLRQRFLYLDDHLGTPCFFSRIDNACSGSCISFIRKSDRAAGSTLHLNHMTRLNIGHDRTGRHPNSILIVFDFSRYSNNHFSAPPISVKYSIYDTKLCIFYILI
ncbi:hypothetical protein D3C74_298570 [compost metagenome]